MNIVILILLQLTFILLVHSADTFLLSTIPGIQAKSKSHIFICNPILGITYSLPFILYLNLLKVLLVLIFVIKYY